MYMNTQNTSIDYNEIAKIIKANIPDYDVEIGGFRSFKIENLITVY